MLHVCVYMCIYVCMYIVTDKLIAIMPWIFFYDPIWYKVLQFFLHMFNFGT